MKRLTYITAVVLILMAAVVRAQTPLEVVQAQLDTYNAQDVEGFANLFAEDAAIYMNLGDMEPGMSGRAEIRERYGAMFQKNPQNRSTLKGRMIQGNFVFDHEWITGRDDPFQIVAIYEVTDGLIQRAWFVR